MSPPIRPARSPLEVLNLHAWPGLTVRPFSLVTSVGVTPEERRCFALHAEPSRRTSAPAAAQASASGKVSVQASVLAYCVAATRGSIRSQPEGSGRKGGGGGRRLAAPVHPADRLNRIASVHADAGLPRASDRCDDAPPPTKAFPAHHAARDTLDCRNGPALLALVRRAAVPQSDYGLNCLQPNR